MRRWLRGTGILPVRSFSRAGSPCHGSMNSLANHDESARGPCRIQPAEVGVGKLCRLRKLLLWQTRRKLPTEPVLHVGRISLIRDRCSDRRLRVLAAHISGRVSGEALSRRCVSGFFARFQPGRIADLKFSHMIANPNQIQAAEQFHLGRAIAEDERRNPLPIMLQR